MGDRERIIGHLRKVPLFTDLSDHELVEIDKLMTEVSISAGHDITRQGKVGRDFIIIEEGHASVSKDGEEVAGVMAGSFVGEVALLDQSRRNATVTAVTPVRAYVLNSAEFRALLEKSPTLRQKIERAAADRRT
jgi:CRP-like cAMP-binding protein